MSEMGLARRALDAKVDYLIKVARESGIAEGRARVYEEGGGGDVPAQALAWRKVFNMLYDAGPGGKTNAIYARFKEVPAEDSGDRAAKAIAWLISRNECLEALEEEGRAFD